MSIIDQYFEALHQIGILNYSDSKESGEEHFLKGYLAGRQTPTIIDVGANQGGYARLVLDICPSARLFAFEPNPASFRDLARDTRLRAFNLALGETEGEVELYDYGDGSEHASLYRAVIEDLHGRAATTQVVPIRRLDQVLAELGVGRIDLLKVDTEGHELSVLRGAEGLIRAGAIDAIQFEFNEMAVVSRTFFKDFWDFLSGFDFFRLLPAGAMRFHSYNAALCEIFAFQNIVCIRKPAQIKA